MLEEYNSLRYTAISQITQCMNTNWIQLEYPPPIKKCRHSNSQETEVKVRSETCLTLKRGKMWCRIDTKLYAFLNSDVFSTDKKIDYDLRHDHYLGIIHVYGGNRVGVFKVSPHEHI